MTLKPLNASSPPLPTTTTILRFHGEVGWGGGRLQWADTAPFTSKAAAENLSLLNTIAAPAAGHTGLAQLSLARPASDSVHLKQRLTRPPSGSMGRIHQMAGGGEWLASQRVTLTLLCSHAVRPPDFQGSKFKKINKKRPAPWRRVADRSM